MDSIEILTVGNARLAEAWRQAERYNATDPASSLAKSRAVGEKLVDLLGNLRGLSRIPHETTDQYLNRLANAGHLPKPYADAFHLVRKLGNLAVHDNEGTAQDARLALNALQKVADWLSPQVAVEQGATEPRAARTRRREPVEQAAITPPTPTNLLDVVRRALPRAAVVLAIGVAVLTLPSTLHFAKGEFARLSQAMNPPPPPPPTPNPSFNCGAASSWVERFICDDVDLATLDHDMAATYASRFAVAPADAREILVKEQRAWLSGRNACRRSGDAATCLRELYRQRVASLQSWQPPVTPSDEDQPSGTFPNPASLSRPSAPASGDEASQANAPPPPSPSVITSPDWWRMPDGNALARYYPNGAARAGISGQAAIRCAVNVDGTLSDCEVVSENPLGYGFGAAALQLAQFFRMHPMARDGVPTAGGVITIPIRFRQ